LAYPFPIPPPAGPFFTWIGQDIQGLAGDEIDLSLQYMTNELGLGFIDDFNVSATRCPSVGPCTLDPNMNVYSDFGRANFANCPQTDPNTVSTGFRLATTACDVTLTLPADGLWTVYIGVIQGLGDNFQASGILVDNVRQLREVVPVSSPGTLPLLLLGIGLAGFTVSRQRGRLT